MGHLPPHGCFGRNGKPSGGTAEGRLPKVRDSTFLGMAGEELPVCVADRGVVSPICTDVFDLGNRQLVES